VSPKFSIGRDEAMPPRRRRLQENRQWKIIWLNFVWFVWRTSKFVFFAIGNRLAIHAWQTAFECHETAEQCRMRSMSGLHDADGYMDRACSL
jgi:hypothetical protein